THALTPTEARPTVQLQPTMVAQQPINLMVLLGGFAIIAVLLVVVVVLVLNFNRSPGTDLAPTQSAANPTAEPIAANPTSPAPGVPQPTAAPSLERITFWSDQSLGDTLNVQVNGLTQPPTGESYAVWLVNTSSDATHKVGTLRVDPLGNGQLAFRSSD